LISVIMSRASVIFHIPTFLPCLLSNDDLSFADQVLCAVFVVCSYSTGQTCWFFFPRCRLCTRLKAWENPKQITLGARFFFFFWFWFVFAGSFLSGYSQFYFVQLVFSNILLQKYTLEDLPRYSNDKASQRSNRFIRMVLDWGGCCLIWG